MTVRRWAGTTALMAAPPGRCGWSGPGLSEVRDALADPQGLVDRSGPDALVLVCVPLLAWLCWAWGALGLLLTAASTVPGSPAGSPACCSPVCCRPVPAGPPPSRSGSG